jgi:uncharacterized protein
MPDPALYSDHGAWESYAKELMEKSDSLALVANIRKTHALLYQKTHLMMIL